MLWKQRGDSNSHAEKRRGSNPLVPFENLVESSILPTAGDSLVSGGASEF